jgi:hypothetical protein
MEEISPLVIQAADQISSELGHIQDLEIESGPD